MDRINVILFGPTSVGKGRCVFEIESALADTIHTVGTGDLARDKMKEDPDFEAVYLPIMKEGEPLPDDVILPLATTHYQVGLELRRTGFVLDGVPRNPDQIRALSDRRIICRSNTFLVDLHASHDTCEQRMKHRAARQNRPDDQFFSKRYQAHYNLRCAVLGKASKIGIEVFHIDADRELDDVASEVLGIFVRKMESRFNGCDLIAGCIS